MAYAIIRPKRGTAAEWLSADPILRDGEIGIETCPEGTGRGMCRIKFGDGKSKWSALPYGICPESYFANVGTDGLVSNTIFAPVAEQVEVNRTTITSLATNLSSLSNKVTNNENRIDGYIENFQTIFDFMDEKSTIIAENTFNNISKYTHSKSNTVHNLIGEGPNVKFIATAVYNKGDKFSVNGQTMTIVTQNGDTLEDKFFVAGALVQCFIEGNTINFKTGGAGSSLNFTVVKGTTQPSSPAENTIWVNTATTISKWSIKGSINTSVAGTSGEVVLVAKMGDGISAIKGNNKLYFIPVKAYQYVSGAWQSKKVSYYVNGKWVSGGFVITADNWTPSGTTKVTNVSGGVRIECVTQSEYSHATLKDKIDLTGISSIEMKVKAVKGNMGSGFYTLFTVTKSKPTGNIYAEGDVGIVTGTGTFSINTSALSGEYYLTVQAGYQTGTYIDVESFELK